MHAPTGRYTHTAPLRGYWGQWFRFELFHRSCVPSSHPRQHPPLSAPTGRTVPRQGAQRSMEGRTSSACPHCQPGSRDLSSLFYKTRHLGEKPPGHLRSLMETPRDA